MADLDFYRQCIEQVLIEYSQLKPKYGDIELQVAFDHERNHYYLVSLGWHRDRRINGIVLHIDIKNDKIWIQQDGTECGVTDDLLALGIPKTAIVLAFYPAYMRQHTEFAVE